MTLLFRYVLMAIICNAICFSSAKSQDFDLPIITYRTQQAANAILSDYLRHASDKDQKVIRNIFVNIDGTDNNVYDVRAQIIDGRREIVIPIAFILATYNVNVALADNITFGGKGYVFKDWDYVVTDHLSDYTEYVADALKGSDIAVRTGGKAPGIMDFCMFRRLPDKECAKRAADPSFLTTLANVEYSALSFIIGHEIGHHVLGHLSNGKTLFLSKRDIASQEMETAADIYSTKAMVRSGRLVDGAMATMFLFSYLQGTDALLDGVSGDHPYPLCRWIKMAEVEQEELPKNKELVQSLNDLGYNFEAGKAGIDALKATAPQCHL